MNVPSQLWFMVETFVSVDRAVDCLPSAKLRKYTIYLLVRGYIKFEGHVYDLRNIGAHHISPGTRSCSLATARVRSTGVPSSCILKGIPQMQASCVWGRGYPGYCPPVSWEGYPLNQDRVHTGQDKDAPPPPKQAMPPVVRLTRLSRRTFLS